MLRKTFLRTAIITAAVFFLGIFLGILFDAQRVEETKEKLTKMDIDWNDAKVQSLYYQTFSNALGFCGSATAANMEFADKIYKEGLEIERYEKINRFTPSLILEKKRYALLQLQFLLNAINLKETCNVNYSTIVYFYSHYDESLKIQQDLQSASLIEIIHECKPQPAVVPIPSDLDIITVNLLKRQHNITKIPSLLIDESIVLEGLQTKNSIKQRIAC